VLLIRTAVTAMLER